MVITTTNSSDALKQLLNVDVDMAIYGELLRPIQIRSRLRSYFRMSYGLWSRLITLMPISKYLYPK